MVDRNLTDRFYMSSSSMGLLLLLVLLLLLLSKKYKGDGVTVF